MSHIPSQLKNVAKRYAPSGANSYSEYGSVEMKRIANAVRALEPSPPPSYRGTGGGNLPEQVYDALASAKIETNMVARFKSAEWRHKLFNQLDSLHEITEWEDGDAPLSLPSMRTFLRTILFIDPERGPGLGLSSVGNLIAAWTKGKDRLTMEFLPNDIVRWAAVSETEVGTERGTGECSASRIKSVLAPYNPEHWFVKNNG